MKSPEITPVFPVFDGETFIEWAQRFLAESDQERIRQMNCRVEAARERDAIKG